jgi:hypothetical protein
MKRDPFFQQLIRSLEGELDPETFERCCASVLKVDFPTLVPVRGGKDGGMDGAVGDGDGRAYPLVTTTDQDAIGNLTKNLHEYTSQGGPRRKLIFATSRSLTARRRKNLEVRAEECGFELVQIYDQSAIADVLYHRPEWCKELLGLDSLPPALSAIPVSNRSLLGGTVVGRDDETTWLRQLSSDGLLVGQPGCGKTCILRALAQEDWGLFVVTDDLSLILPEIRRLQPKRLILDDAHARCDVLDGLLAIRKTGASEFSLVAVTWPWAALEIAAKMDLDEAQQCDLPLLTQQEMIEVVSGAGLGGPPGLIDEIVHQSEGRPGLAVTLVQLCLAEGTKQVALASALARDVRTTVRALVGEEAEFLLAALSIGGSSGLSLFETANVLGLGLATAEVATAKLAAGGVLLQAQNGNLTVRPRRLQQALVRDVFLTGAHGSTLERLLDIAPREEAVLVLIGAHALGAQVPFTTFSRLLDTCGPKEWAAFASLSADYARYALRERPEFVLELAPNGLETAPEDYIPPLLALAKDDNRELHNNTEHPLRLIQDWVQGAGPGPRAAQVRTTLMRVALSWARSSDDWIVFGRTAAIALHPGFQSIESRSTGNSINITWGLLHAEQLEQVGRLWDRLSELPLTVPAMVHVMRTLEDWAYPSRSAPNGVPTAAEPVIRGVLDRAVRVVAAASEGHPGLLKHVRGIAMDRVAELSIDVDAEFETIFPDDPYLEDHNAVLAAQAEKARQLGRTWATSNARLTARRFVSLENEAIGAGITWPRYASTVAATIAENCESPVEWADALIEAGGWQDVITPFCRRAMQTLSRSEWNDILLRCLSSPAFHFVAVDLCLTQAEFPPDLRKETIAIMDRFSLYAETAFLRGQVSTAVAKEILSNSEGELLKATAVGLWLAEPQGQIPAELAVLWRRAVLENDTDERVQDHWMAQILSHDPRLAHDFLRRRLNDQRFIFLSSLDHHLAVKAAVEALDNDGRRCILNRLPDRWGTDSLVQALVADDTEVYRAILRDRLKKGIRLSPLARDMDSGWVHLALVAIDEGIGIDAIVGATVHRGGVWSGSESNRWRVSLEAFEVLSSSPDSDVAALGSRGKQVVQRELSRALIEERGEDVRGLEGGLFG